MHVIPRPHAELDKHFVLTPELSVRRAPRRRSQLRVYLPIPDLGRAVRRLPGDAHPCPRVPADRGRHALIVEVAPALAIERVTDLALQVGARDRAGHPLRRAPVRCARGAPPPTQDAGRPRRRRRSSTGSARRAAGRAAATYPLRRRDRGHHRPARRDHQPQPRGVDGAPGRDAARRTRWRPRCSPRWRRTSPSGPRPTLTLVSVSMIGAAGPHLHQRARPESVERRATRSPACSSRGRRARSLEQT